MGDLVCHVQVVAAAVVLAKPADDPEALVKDIQRVTGEKLAAFKARRPVLLLPSMCVTDGKPLHCGGRLNARFVTSSLATVTDSGRHGMSERQ